MTISAYGWQDFPSIATPVNTANLEAMLQVAGAYTDAETARAQAAESGKVSTSSLGVANGVGTLDPTGRQPAGQLPLSVALVSTAFLPPASGDTTGATDTAAINTVLARGGTIRPYPNAVAPVYYMATAPI